MCFLTLCTRDYPKRLAFSYLADIHRGFVEELQREHGEAWRSRIDTADRPYKFIKFDKYIQRQRKAYADPSSRDNTARLKCVCSGLLHKGWRLSVLVVRQLTFWPAVAVDVLIVTVRI